MIMGLCQYLDEEVFSDIQVRGTYYIRRSSIQRFLHRHKAKYSEINIKEKIALITGLH